MSATCPQGHTSADAEWCDVCGARIGAPADPTAAASGAAPAGSAAAGTPSGSGAGAAGAAGASPSASGSGAMSASGHAPEPCPHCGDLNAWDALFCEGCGYDFVSGEKPPGAPSTPAAPAPGGASVTPDPAAPTGASTSAKGPADPAMPGSPGTTAPDVSGAAGAAGAAPVGAAAPTPPVASGWVAIVEVNTEWFALKGELADAPCPPASSATVALTGTKMSIGRTSQSRGIHPEIPLDTDTAVSRRHAQLDLADGVWSVTDLGSTNGTHHVTAGSTPSASTVALTADKPSPLADGDRVYLGAWTSITIRRSS